MMEGAGILLIGTAVALMLVTPLHRTVMRLRGTSIDVPGGRGGLDPRPTGPHEP